MPLTLDDNNATFQVRAFKPGCIQINEKIYTSSVIITPQQLITDWRPQHYSELSLRDLEGIVSLKPDILLIGTGATLFFPPIEMYGHLLNLGIGVECMDTRAACRTYNALSAENRNVAAALIIR